MPINLRTELETALRKFGKENSSGIIGEWIESHAGDITSKCLSDPSLKGFIYTDKDMIEKIEPLKKMIAEAKSAIDLIATEDLCTELRNRSSLLAIIFRPISPSVNEHFDVYHGSIDSLIASLARLKATLLDCPVDHTDEIGKMGDEETPDDEDEGG